MSDKDAFEERLERLAASSAKVADPARRTPHPQGAAPKPKGRRPSGLPLLRLGFWAFSILGLVGVVAVMTDGKFDVAQRENGLWNPSFLQDSVESQMTPEEIERMNSDPRLEGKSRMEKLLLSN